MSGGPLGYDRGDYTYEFGGTSSACPLVAGIAALLLSIDPNLSGSAVKSILQTTARKIGRKTSYDANGHSPLFGYGCVNAGAAVAKTLEGAQPAVVTAMARRANHR